MARLLVTGGAGFIGSHCARALRARGHAVVVLDDLSEGHADAVLGAPLVEGDILDGELVLELLEDRQIEAVLHFAARCYVGESMTQPDRYWRINRDGTRSLLGAMAEAGVGSLVFSSTCAVYGQPDRVPIREDTPRRPVSVYGQTKAAMEDEIAAAGLRAVVLRYFNAAGASEDGVLGERHEPETHLIPLALAAARTGGTLAIFGGDYPTPDGTAIRDYVHVCDLADAHVLAVERLLAGGPSLTANLGYGAGHSVRQVCSAVEAVTERPLATELAPRRAGDPPELWADARRARQDLGWAPSRTALSTMVRHAWLARRA